MAKRRLLFIWRALPMRDDQQTQQGGLSVFVWIAIGALLLFVSLPILVRLSAAWPPVVLERRTPPCTGS